MYDLKECTINNKHSYFLEYYSKIKSGEIIAGHELIQCLENCIEDLDNPEYFYDTKDADFRIAFIEGFCKHTKAPFFGKPFLLELWEKAFVEVFYSFKSVKTGLRKYREALLMIGRKNGKTTFCSALANAEFFCGGGGTDIVCSSNDDAQASIIFDEINNMREWSPALKKRSHKNNKGLSNLKNKSTVKKLSDRTKNKEGRNIDFGVLDEIHEMKTNVIYKSIQQSQSTKAQPILFLITTEGFVNDGFLDKKLKYDRKVLNREIDDPTVLVWLYTQDSENEVWQNKKSWQKSNPNLGTVKKYSYLEGQLRLAQQDKAERAFTMAKDFNIKQNNAEAWLTPEDIENSTTFNIEDFRNCYGIGAGDLSKTGDLTSAKILLMKPNDNHKYFIQKYFIPQSKLEKLNKTDLEKFKEWIRAGYITLSEGNENDFSLVTQWFVDMYSNYGIRVFKTGYDKWSAVYWTKEMEGQGFEMQKVDQNWGTMSDAMKLVEADLKSNLIVYNNNPIDKWCLQNTALNINNEQQIMPIKVEGQEDKKIDGAVTMIIAYRVYIDNRPEFLQYVKNM